MVVLAGVGHGEHQVHLREERGRAQVLVIGARGEVQPVRPGRQELRTKVLRPACGIRGARRTVVPAPAAARLKYAGDAGSRAPGPGVQDVGGHL